MLGMTCIQNLSKRRYEWILKGMDTSRETAPNLEQILSF